MQPQFRQMPPGRSRSTHAVLKPSCAPRMAATYPPGPAPTTTRSYLSAMKVSHDLKGQRDRLLEDADDGLQHLGAERAVDDAVVAGERDRHALPHDDLVVLDDRLLAYGPHGEDGPLGRVDDGGEVADAQHAEVRDGERRACVLLGPKLPVARALGHLARLRGDLTDGLLVGVADDRRGEAVLDRDGHADVDAGVLDDGLLGEGGVGLGDAAQRERAGLEDEVVPGEL